MQNLLSQEQAAEFLGVKSTTLENWRVRPPRGGGPVYVKIGGRVRYCESDLVAFVDGRRHTNTSTSGMAQG